MSVDWMARQMALMSSSRPMQLEVPRYNPRPPGVIREGSATHAVLVFLREHPRMFFTHFQIVSKTGRSPKSVDWALIFLRTQKLVECVPDSMRNSRYLRYRITTVVKE